MRVSITALLPLVAGALAMPQPAHGIVVRTDQICGNNLEMYCCNKNEKSGDTKSDGLLSGLNLLNDFQLFSGCSKLSVSAIIGLTDFLNDQCQQQVTCCKSGDVKQDGLINVNALNCVPVNV
ncbi:hypothetical protein DL771_008796 [Monosporascus sp. 5C6A]|nr:hypothetical protein DL771_008796 [Monosporascus sp. 5C6A]